MNKRVKGLAIICDADFNLISVLHDDFEVIDDSMQNLTFLRIIEKSSLERAFQFQKEIRTHRVAFNWEMVMTLHDTIETCFFTGIKKEDQIFIVVTRNFQEFSQFYHEYKEIFNEQISLLKGINNVTQKIQQTEIDANIYEEFSHINNELTDLHRELSKKNIKMQKQQEQLQLINRILRHDLANFFSVIYSAVRLYKREPEMKFLDEISKSSMRGVELIRNMKHLEKVFGDNAQIYKREIRPVVEKIITSYPKIEFEVNLQDSTILADEGLESLIDNIISNAIKHGGTKKIIIDSEISDNAFLLKIADFGKGIPDEIKPHIFDENFKAGSTGNTGLGLYIVKKTIERYRGSVTVEDNEPCGAKFIISLNCE